MKYLFMISGIATKADKSRNVSVGDSDTHAVISPTEQVADAIANCSLENPVVLSKVVMNKDWR